MNIANDMIQLVGKTPMVHLNRVNKDCKATVVAKLEYFNPCSSIKDRIGMSMMVQAQKAGLIDKDTVIIEPTSGNTGIALAFMCAVKGYRLILTMPENMSMERRRLLKGLGAELVLTPSDKGMKGAVAKAEEISAEIGNSFIPMQFNNPANPDIHEKTTAQEIWVDTSGMVDIFVAGVGTGGTITGVSKALKKLKSGVKSIAVEPQSSAVLSGGSPGRHKIQGIGAGFVPDVLNLGLVDEVFAVTDAEAFSMARRLIRQEGIICGISSGAIAHAAIEIAKRPDNEGKMIVFIVCDTGERYLSTELFNE